MSRLFTCVAIAIGLIAAASGHELPDGQIDRRVQITVKEDCVLIEYSLAMSESTLGQQLEKAGQKQLGDFSAKWDRYKSLIPTVLAKEMQLQLAGQRLNLKPIRAEFSGRSHRHLECLFRAEVTLVEQPRALSFADNNFRGSPGMYRIAMKPRGVTLQKSNAPLLVSKATPVEIPRQLPKEQWEAATTAYGKVSVKGKSGQPDEALFPDELVKFSPYSGNPVFAGTDADTWDRKIRERGCILKEGNKWHLWYTGYRGGRADQKMLGYATSQDGLTWKRHPNNPVFQDAWTEDVHVVRHDDKFYMVAEGLGDIPHLLSSNDGIHWVAQGRIDVHHKDGTPISRGPYGTPTLWVENGTWYLFYERRDHAIWLATSSDRETWTNVQDEPVLAKGPSDYDRHAIALNQVIRYRDRYYAVYHANADANRKGPWTTCLAVSKDFVHWTKYDGNPIVRTNDSSGQLIYDGKRFRLYTAHPDVKVYFPQAK